jgi:alkyl sulfatase BDS1-like metallo-beta-lactamase superfamily hydrolase
LPGPPGLADGNIKGAGDENKLQEMFGLFDSFEFWFDIVMPNPGPAAK